MTGAHSEYRLGADVRDGATRFSAFTDASTCAVRLYDALGREAATLNMEPTGGGYFERTAPNIGHGTLYDFVVGDRRLPDPYARFFPKGVHGPAMVVESNYVWNAPTLSRPLRELVIYELHVGAFSDSGSYAGAMARLEALADLGITALELMPLAAFPGARGWGYDGVGLFAPFAAYGSPDELKAFIDRAHALGFSVLLDVVYNHVGPSGNYLAAYSEHYFSKMIKNAWGDAPDFAHAPMRALVLNNARYWLEEFRFDGLRLDAVHAILDPSPKPILEELVSLAKSLDPPRILIGEDERNSASLVEETGLDALWADDFHHQVRVTLTREHESYYSAYRPGVDGIARTIREGWIYSGQDHPRSGKPRGSSAHGLSAEAFVYCIQNHDQIGNRALGERIHHEISLDAYCAISMLLLFLPMTPLVFMGQEWAASTPFLFFTDHEPELGQLVSEGRRREFKDFSMFSDPNLRNSVPDPQAESTFLRSRLNWDEREQGDHSRVLKLYRDMLTLRRTDPVLRGSGRSELNAEAHDDVLLVSRSRGTLTRTLFVNFGDTALSDLRELTETYRPGTAILRSTADAEASSTLAPKSALIIGSTTNEESTTHD